MSFLEKFKKQKKEEKTSIGETQEKKVASKPVSKKTQEKSLSQKDNSKIAYKVFKSPHVTEKAGFAEENNKYIFKIYSQANKIQVKRAVKEVYGVEPESVNVINIPPKPKRLGRISGFKKGYKKAIVKLKKGDKIEVLPK